MKLVVALADGPFHQLRTTVDAVVDWCALFAPGPPRPVPRVDGIHVVGVEHLIGDRVVQDLPALDVRRANLDHLRPARLGEPGNVHQRAPPLVLMQRRHRLLARLDDDVRRPEAVAFGLPVERASTPAWAAACRPGCPAARPDPPSWTMVSTCSSVSDMSFLNFCTPTLRSMCHGGIWRRDTRSRIERAHGRASW